MSIHFNADKRALRRTTNLPASAAAFTIVGFSKMLVARPTFSPHLAYLQTTGAIHAQAVRLRGGVGRDLYASDSYGANESASVATVPEAGAAGLNWFGWMLRGTAAGAGGMQLSFRPIGGAVSTVAVANTPGSAGFEAIQFGDAPFAAGDFGVPGWWLDGLLAHLKIYDRALSDGEGALELAQGAPATSTGLISYHSFSAGAIGTAVIPDQGTGTFGFLNSAPALSSDMPVFSSVPTLTLTDTLPQSQAVVPPGAPTLNTATVTGARSIAVTFTAGSGTNDGFRMYAQRVGAPAFVAGVAASGATTITGTGLDPNVAYEVWVAGFNGAGESAASSRLARTTWRIKVRLSKVDKAVANTAGWRVIAWLAPIAAGDLVGDKVSEATNVAIGAAAFDSAEGDQVCTVDADFSGLPNSMIAAGTPIVATLNRTATDRWARITSAAVIEEP